VKFKTDENLPLEASAVLRERGFDAEPVWDEQLSGADDWVIAARVQSEGRILLTLDLDFANIQAYRPDQYAGIIVLRLEKQDKATVGPTWPGLQQLWASGAQLVSCGLYKKIASAFAPAVELSEALADLWAPFP